MEYRVAWKQNKKDETKYSVWYSSQDDAERMAKSITDGGDTFIAFQTRGKESHDVV